MAKVKTYGLRPSSGPLDSMHHDSQRGEKSLHNITTYAAIPLVKEAGLGSVGDLLNVLEAIMAEVRYLSFTSSSSSRAIPMALVFTNMGNMVNLATSLMVGVYSPHVGTKVWFSQLHLDIISLRLYGAYSARGASSKTGPSSHPPSTSSSSPSKSQHIQPPGTKQLAGLSSFIQTSACKTTPPLSILILRTNRELTKIPSSFG